MKSRLCSWWQQPDQFDAMTAFLRQRGLLPSAQRIMATVAVSSTLVPLTVLVGQARYQSTSALVVCSVISVFTLGVAAFWLTRWPTRRQSEAFVLAGTACIAWWSLMQTWPGISALGCTALAVTGAYIAVFHSTKTLVLNFVVAIGTALVMAVRLSQVSDVATAVVVFWLVWFLNLSICLGIWGLARAMGIYARRADQDSLTGLLNRRGFIDTISAAIHGAPPAHTHLAVLMVDIDDFKRINDTYGHAVGDNVLLAVADRLRERTPASAVICRAGGEEFLIAVTVRSDDHVILARRLCDCVAALPHQITASIGVSTAPLHHVTGPDGRAAVDRLVAAADTAMYAAKRDGGNQSGHAVPQASH